MQHVTVGKILSEVQKLVIVQTRGGQNMPEHWMWDQGQMQQLREGEWEKRFREHFQARPWRRMWKFCQGSQVECGVEGTLGLAGRAGSGGSLIPHLYRERCSSSSVSPKILITLFSDECGLHVYIKHDKHFAIIS